MSKYDKMIACNRESSKQKIELARETILEMLDRNEKISIPKLIEKTGLSRGFFYKNPIIRNLLDEAAEKQIGLADPRKKVLNMVMDAEIITLCRKIRALEQENQSLTEEVQKLRKALDRKNMNLLRSL